MKESQRKYLEEYEKYKHISITEGSYHIKDKPYLKYEVVSVDMEEEKAVIEREDSRQTKTLHWCRKNLIKKGGYKNAKST
jgi:hypothetical protein